MSISKGNELLQELYTRLKGLWEQGQPFPKAERIKLIKEIAKEYENDTYIEGNN